MIVLQSDKKISRRGRDIGTSVGLLQSSFACQRNIEEMGGKDTTTNGSSVIGSNFRKTILFTDTINTSEIGV